MTRNFTNVLFTTINSEIHNLVGKMRQRGMGTKAQRIRSLSKLTGEYLENMVMGDDGEVLISIERVTSIIVIAQQ